MASMKYLCIAQHLLFSQYGKIKKNNKMKNQNFTVTMKVDQLPEEVFNRINNVRGWWSENIDRETRVYNKHQ